MIPGALGCHHCNLKYRFKNEAEAEDDLAGIRRGDTASAAIHRELKCYTMDKENYPFKSEPIK